VRYYVSMTTEEYEQTAQRMRPRLTELGRTFFSNAAQADDAAQEALVRLWLLRDRVADVGHAEALLVRMTKNICVSEWRRTNKQQPLTETHNVMTEEAQPMADDDNLRQLQQAIGRLPQSEQRLFRMRHELGMDIQQIAAATGLQPRSVSAVISKARRTIIEQLKQGGIIA